MTPTRQNSPAALSEIGLEHLIAADQLGRVRRSVRAMLPVNVLLGIAVMLVASHYGDTGMAVGWFVVSSAVNLLRATLSFWPLGDSDGARPDPALVQRHLFLSAVASGLSGIVWAFVALLSDAYTSTPTLFFFTTLCGITAGAVSYGDAYAKMPIAFIAPPLVVAIVCLVAVGGFDRYSLAATVMLYLVALTWGSFQSETQFRGFSRLANEAGQMARSLEVAHVEAAALAEDMSFQASHDALTGLLNRGGFMAAVASRMQDREAQFCLMLLDLDGFKSINDAFGHGAGDRVLVEVARRLQQTLADDVIVARLGGDEFVILYRHTNEHEAQSLLATQLIAAIAIPFAAFDAGRVGVSIGIFTASDVAIGEMMIRADAALYAAKNAGRNRYSEFDDVLSQRLDMHRDVERDLMGALGRSELEMWYQPVYGNGGDMLVSLEALVRWKHPRHGWIPPTELISVAAMAGMSEPLMKFILSSVCDMIAALGEHPRLWVAMNVSPREMSQIAMEGLVLGVLARHNLAPTMLEIEITEESAIDIRAVQQKLLVLSDAGVRIAIDDFGTGYSSLASLRQLSVDRLKIDKCFVTGIATSPGDQALVQAILSLGQALKIEVVAEGVETADDLRTLRAFGCTLMQGYYMGRPMPFTDALALARQSERVW